MQDRSIPFELHNVHDTLITDIDASWTREGGAGIGFLIGEGSSGNTIQHVVCAKPLYRRADVEHA